MSPVMAIELCPGISETTLSGTPPVFITLAAEWRRVCSPACGRPAFVAATRRARKALRGSHGSPNSVVKTKPVEPVWAHLTRSLANLTKHNIAELTALVKTRLKRMQCRPGCWSASSPVPDSSSDRSATPTLNDLYSSLGCVKDLGQV